MRAAIRASFVRDRTRAQAMSVYHCVVLAHELLSKVRFGSGVAEQDTELERYFVQTQEFREIVRGDADVILGIKGSGKSAISRVLGGRKLGIPEIASTRIVTAFQTQTDALFRNIPQSVTESTMRQLWIAYIISLAAHELLAVPEFADRAADFSAELEAADLSISVDADPESTMREMVDSLPTVSKSPRAKSRRRQQSQTVRWLTPDYDFEPLVRRIAEGFRSLSIECWILLDRLDEAFVAEPDREIPTLRGLLRAYLDIASMTRVLRPIIFLRSDIYRRVTQTEGFRNLDHVQDVVLSWNRDEVVELIAERIRVTGEAPEDSVASSVAVVGRFLPPLMQYFTGFRHTQTETLDWCIEVTASRKGEPSPRNLIRLFREAQQVATRRWERSSETYPPLTPLLGESDLLSAWDTLSRARLDNTMYAEYNSLRPYVESFRKAPPIATRQTLADRFRQVAPDCDPSAIIDELVGAGFLHESGQESFEVAPLYFKALDIGLGTAGRADQFRVVSVGGATSPQEARDIAKELSSAGRLADAVRLLIRGYSVPTENAVLAANIAVESRSVDLMRSVDMFLEREQYASRLLGKRIALKRALRKVNAANALSSSITDGEALDYAVGQFIGSLTFDPKLELDMWRDILTARPWAAADASLWDSIAPVVAASRLLAVARGTRTATEPFEAAVERVYSHWYPADHASEPQPLVDFLEAYTRDSNGTVIGVFSYQVLGIAAVLRLSGQLSLALEGRVESALVESVRASEERHQRSFRDWSAMDVLAARISRTLGWLA